MLWNGDDDAATAPRRSAQSAQDLSRYGDEGLRAELSAIADAQTAVLVPMRDGVGLSTNIWRPKGATGPLPTILWKTPYNEHVPRGSTARYAVETVRNGYAFIVQNERGRYFSEGNWEILGNPQTDGYDTLSWIADQPWSNGKVGTLGCSSSAEWQLALAALNFVVLAITVSSVNPRAGRSGNLVFALFAFVVYYNLLNLGQSWIGGGRTTAAGFLLGLHGTALAAGLLWLAKQQLPLSCRVPPCVALTRQCPEGSYHAAFRKPQAQRPRRAAMHPGTPAAASPRLIPLHRPPSLTRFILQIKFISVQDDPECRG